MLSRVVFSACLACGLATASDQPMSVLSSSTTTLQAGTQTALQNAINTVRQKKAATQNVLQGGINWPYVLGNDRPKLILRTSARAQSTMPACSIPLTQERLSTGTRFELHRIYPPNSVFDSMMKHPGLPVCHEAQ